MNRCYADYNAEKLSFFRLCLYSTNVSSQHFSNIPDGNYFCPVSHVVDFSFRNAKPIVNTTVYNEFDIILIKDNSFYFNSVSFWSFYLDVITLIL